MVSKVLIRDTIIHLFPPLPGNCITHVQTGEVGLENRDRWVAEQVGNRTAVYELYEQNAE